MSKTALASEAIRTELVKALKADLIGPPGVRRERSQARDRRRREHRHARALRDGRHRAQERAHPALGRVRELDPEAARRLPGADELAKTRGILVDEAARAQQRMAEGIRLLEESARVRNAFKMANLAMHVAAKQADTAREDPRYKNGKEPAWRPFQLAFILLNLASIADPNHGDRKVADLIYPGCSLERRMWRSAQFESALQAGRPSTLFRTIGTAAPAVEDFISDH